MNETKYKHTELGPIPEHWELRQWQYLLQENVTTNTDCKETHQLQFKYGDIVSKANQEVAADTLKIISKYTKVQPNDIMINGLNLNYDFISQRIGMVRTNGIITSAYISLRPTEEANPSYYNYLLKAMDAQKMFHGMGTGVRLTLSYKELKNKYLPFPPLAEQEAMVAYLDEQTGKIDAAIEREQKMIDLLNERKQIIIQQAVTKGLNPNATMKDSGVEWIGEIPEGWNVKKIKFLFDLITKRSCSEKKIGLENIESKSGKYIETYSIYDGNGIAVEKGDIVYGKLRPYLCKAWLAEWECNAVGDFYVFRSKGDIEPQYAQLLFLSKAFSDECTAATYGAKMPRVSSDFIRSLSFAYPSSKEQKEILVYLEEKLAGIDRAIEAREKMIALLQERKQIIINEVVTGKIKVL